MNELIFVTTNAGKVASLQHYFDSDYLFFVTSPILDHKYTIYFLTDLRKLNLQ